MLDDFVTIEEAMNTNLIPESYHDIFSHYKKCPDPNCGYPIMINHNRTIMKCLNPGCRRILSYRVLKVFSYFGISNFGPQSAYDYVNGMDINTVPEALKNPPPEIKNKIDAWLNSPHTLGQVLEILAIPNISSKAHKMLDSIPDWDTFTRYVEAYGVRKVMFDCGIYGKLKPEWWEAMKKARMLGYSWEKWSGFILKSSETKNIPFNDFEEFDTALKLEGLTEIFQIQLGGTGRDGAERAEDIYLYWDEFKELCSMIACFVGNVRSQKIVITGDIVLVSKPDGSMYDRLEFVDFINSIAIKHGVQFENSLALKSTNYVIADYPSNTKKYLSGLASGKLISSDKFLDMVVKGEI